MAAETFSLQLREVVVGPADFEMQHLELAATLDDGIEDGVEQLRVDQVALGLDDDGVQRCVGHDRKLDYSDHGPQVRGYAGRQAVAAAA